MRPRVLLAAVLATVVLAGLGLAQAVRDQPARTPDLVAAEVATSLRCPTCQGLSVADSPAQVAQGMQEIIAEQAAQGRTPEEIRQFFVDRYGEWILLSPPRQGLGWLVWLLPATAVAAGMMLALRAARRRRETEPVGEADLERAHLVYADHRAGRYIPDTTPAADRVEAALELLDSIDEDHAVNGGPAREDALQRLAAALTQVDATPAAAPAEAANHERAAPPAAARSARHRLGYAVAAGFLAVLAGLLVTSLGARGPDGLPTGLFAQGSPASDAEAEVDALRALTGERPDDPEVWLTLGRVLDDAGQIGAAHTAYQQALDLDPDNTEARQLAAWTLIRGSSPDEAIPLLEPLVTDDVADAQSVLLLGLAQYGADQPAATATLRRYLELAPVGPQSNQIRALLREPSTPSQQP